MKTIKLSPANELIYNSKDPLVVKIRDGNLSQNEVLQLLIPAIIDYAKRFQNTVKDLADKEVFEESLIELQTATNVYEQFIHSFALQTILYSSLSNYTHGLENLLKSILKVNKIK